MTAPCIAVFVLLATVAVLATGNRMCPQAVANDPSTVFCATNAYGSLNVRRSEFENWNCNHPFNKYTQTSLIACNPGPTVITCVPAACDNVGPTVCARLASPDPRKPRAFTTAIFANQCALTLYNCRNPMQRYVLDTTTTNPLCKSPGM